MKSFKGKQFVAGVLIGGMVFGGAPVFASVAQKNIAINYNDIKIVVDGQKLETANEPFIYNGTTYLPVRAVSQAVGKKVTWDGNTSTVYLGEVPEQQTVAPVSTPAQTTSATTQNVPTEYQNALKKAESYSNLMHMSKKGLYDQLTSEYGEKFSPEAAQYAIDNLKVDYKLNALKKAESYYKNMSMSKDRVYDQLTSEYGEQFTAEEAQYAIDHLE